MNNLQQLRSVAFCKIIAADFIPELLIPPGFVEKHGPLFRRKVTLKIDEQSEKSWDVKIEKGGDKYWFTQGWLQFMKENKIDFPDFCVFRFVRNTKIIVEIFDKNGCKRPDNQIVILGHEQENTDNETETSSSADVHPTCNENIKFSFVWKKHIKNCMFIKGSICDKTGLRGETEVTMKNKYGCIKRVKLFKNQKIDNRVGLGLGWAEFVNASNLVEGKTYQFEFIRGPDDKLELLQLSSIKKVDYMNMLEPEKVIVNS